MNDFNYLTFKASWESTPVRLRHVLDLLYGKKLYGTVIR